MQESSETILMNPSFISDETSIAEMSSFCYLGDIIGGEGSAERAVRMRIAAAWSKWRELADKLRNRWIPIKYTAIMYNTCVRATLLYASETWPLTQNFESCIRYKKD